MKKILFLLVLLFIACSEDDELDVEIYDIYHNNFNNISSLDNFTIFEEEFVHYYIPPLNTVSIVSNQLQIDTDFNRPNGPEQPPLLCGRAALSLNTSNILIVSMTQYYLKTKVLLVGA